jgi:hypothetical protein
MDWYPSEQYGFDVTKDNRFTLPDKQTEVFIPAYALAESGWGVMSVSSGSRMVELRDLRPLLTFDISFMVDGQPVHKTKPVIIDFPLHQDRLAKYGARPDDVVVGSFDDQAMTWTLDPLEQSYDAQTNRLKASVTHFTVWGALIDLSKALAHQAPSNLTARKVKAKKAKKLKNNKDAKNGRTAKPGKRSMQLCWEAPAAALGSAEYQLDLLLVSKSKKKTDTIRTARKTKSKKKTTSWDKAATRTVTTTCQALQLKAGQYSFRVRTTANGVNSDALNFKVK